ncbi:MAG: DUF86 domain-containing protein [Methanomicrobiales archaeon]|nr:DUF86 domain-containing protein [Methanomicrobiales archaeon]
MKQKRLRETIIRIKITEIVECVTLVRENLPQSVKDFMFLGLVKDGIYKRIEFAIEDIFDICAIVNTDLELGIPGEDDDILDNLVNKNIISKQMQEKIHAMKGFRNIVVHRYGKIDDQLAFDLLTAHLNDFADFIDEIEKFLPNGHL